MELKIRLEIDVTDKFAKLTRELYQAATAIAVLNATENEMIGKSAVPAADNAVETSAAPAASETPQVSAPAEAPVETPTPAETPAEPAAPAAPAQLTEVDVREAMRATRARIIGPDWETNKTTDNYKRWYKSLNAWFKTTAAECGAEKPSALPDHESRKNFINQCQTVEIVDGALGQPLPF